MNVKSHALPQDNLILTQDNANALLTKKETLESGMKQPKNADAHQTSHFGTEDIVLSAQPELNLMIKKNNAITAPTDLSETDQATPASQDIDHDRFIGLFV